MKNLVLGMVLLAGLFGVGSARADHHHSGRGGYGGHHGHCGPGSNYGYRSNGVYRSNYSSGFGNYGGFQSYRSYGTAPGLYFGPPSHGAGYRGYGVGNPGSNRGGIGIYFGF